MPQESARSSFSSNSQFSFPLSVVCHYRLRRLAFGRNRGRALNNCRGSTSAQDKVGEPGGQTLAAFTVTIYK